MTHIIYSVYMATLLGNKCTDYATVLFLDKIHHLKSKCRQKKKINGSMEEPLGISTFRGQEEEYPAEKGENDI